MRLLHFLLLSAWLQLEVKLSALDLGLWPLALSQRLFSAITVQVNTSSTKQAVGRKHYAAVKLMEHLALKCDALARLLTTRFKAFKVVAPYS